MEKRCLDGLGRAMELAEAGITYVFAKEAKKMNMRRIIVTFPLYFVVIILLAKIRFLKSDLRRRISE